jgi:hypothetical protein
MVAPGCLGTYDLTLRSGRPTASGSRQTKRPWYLSRSDRTRLWR